MAIAARWLTSFDIDLGLCEVRDNPDEPWTKRALAGASVGVDPSDAYYAASELLNVVEWIVRGEPDGKKRLARILGCPGNDYQRCLWYMVAGRDPLGLQSDLAWLATALSARLSAMQANLANELGVHLTPDPYLSDCADGPLGVFSGDFVLAAHWRPFTQAL